MATELKKFGVSVRIENDTIVVYPAQFHAPDEVLYGHNDHRIVMALAIAATLGHAPVTIEDAQAVAKSFPDFFDVLSSIGGRIEVIHE